MLINVSSLIKISLNIAMIDLINYESFRCAYNYIVITSKSTPAAD